MLTPPIVTERLILRNVRLDDAENIWSLWGQPDTGKYLADEYYKDPDALRAIFHDVDDWTDYSFVAFSRETEEFMGTCSVGPIGSEGEWGFGYCVVKDHWNNGYATEMAKALVDFARKMGVRHFKCTVAIENTASGRVMQKCGLHVDHQSSFKKRGTDIVYPSHIYKM